MARAVLLLLALAVVAIVGSVQAAEPVAHATWGYDDDSTTLFGPSHWGEVDVNCDGSSQSPIDVRTSDVVLNASYGALNVSYSPDRTLTLANNGHTTVVSDLDGEDFIDDIITAPGLLDGQYRLAQFHLHWGQADYSGSEHRINGLGTPAELHLVHYNTRYSSVNSAVASGNPDALAVMGVFFKISENANQKTPTALAEIIKQTPSVMSTETDSAIAGPLDLSTLLPKDRSYYTYSGSLTTPTCNQVVRWILLEKAMTITRAELDTLRATLIETSPTMSARSSTFRPVQPLNNRVVYKSLVLPSTSSSDATSVVVSMVLVALLAVVAL